MAAALGPGAADSAVGAAADAVAGVAGAAARADLAAGVDLVALAR